MISFSDAATAEEFVLEIPYVGNDCTGAVEKSREMLRGVN